jgi:PilZ domain
MAVETPAKIDSAATPAGAGGAPASPPSEQDFPQKRRSRRVKMQRPVRVRPSEPRDDHFEDLISSINASKEGIYFHSRRQGYYKGMRVFVTFPYTSGHDPMNCEYVAEVVRVEDLPNRRFGVAVELKMSLNYGQK